MPTFPIGYLHRGLAKDLQRPEPSRSLLSRSLTGGILSRPGAQYLLHLQQYRPRQH